MIKWEELPKDGAHFKCSITTFVPNQWDCPREASKAMSDRDYDRVKKVLPKNIILRGRALCWIHQTMVERDFK